MRRLIVAVFVVACLVAVAQAVTAGEPCPAPGQLCRKAFLPALQRPVPTSRLHCEQRLTNGDLDPGGQRNVVPGWLSNQIWTTNATAYDGTWSAGLWMSRTEFSGSRIMQAVPNPVLEPRLASVTLSYAVRFVFSQWRSGLAGIETVIRGSGDPVVVDTWDQADLPELAGRWKHVDQVLTGELPAGPSLEVGFRSMATDIPRGSYEEATLVDAVALTVCTHD